MNFTSQHAKGEAADFEIFGISNKELADWIHYKINYDQLILEYWKEEDPNSGWVHCSYSEGNNRRQYLKAYKYFFYLREKKVLRFWVWYFLNILRQWVRYNIENEKNTNIKVGIEINILLR